MDYNVNNIYQDINWWLQNREKVVLERMMSIKGAMSDGIGKGRFVYIPGFRKDRVLLVAHSDTVWHPLPIVTKLEGEIIVSANIKEEYRTVLHDNKEIISTGWGIGADDRAGMAAIWELRNLGHSILITSGEEAGGIAASRLMRSDYWSEEINNHQFMIEIDRHGKKQMVFYDVFTDDFMSAMIKYTGYKVEIGTFTDICRLCKNICGVNISLGYSHEHTAMEQLNIRRWHHTVEVLTLLLRQNNIPKFELPPPEKDQSLVTDHKGWIEFGKSSSNDSYVCKNCGYLGRSWEQCFQCGNTELVRMG